MYNSQQLQNSELVVCVTMVVCPASRASYVSWRTGLAHTVLRSRFAIDRESENYIV